MTNKKTEIKGEFHARKWIFALGMAFWGAVIYSVSLYAHTSYVATKNLPEMNAGVLVNAFVVLFVLFWSGQMIILCWRVYRFNGPILNISEDGVFDPRFCPVLIPWEQTLGYTLKGQKSNRQVVLLLKPDSFIRPKVHITQRLWNYFRKPSVTIAPVMLREGFGDILAAMKHFNPDLKEF